MEKDEMKFTDAHRAAATRAYVNGMVVVLDKGPHEPVKADMAKGEYTDAEIEAENTRMVLAKREHDEWHEKNKEPVAVEMHKVDADHAVNSDPDRYIRVPRGERAPVTVEERLTRLEQRLGPETPEEIERRRERDAKIAKDRTEAAKKPDAQPYRRSEPRVYG